MTEDRVVPMQVDGLVSPAERQEGSSKLMPSDVQDVCDSSINEQEKSMGMESVAAADAEREKDQPAHERNEGGEHETSSAGERHYLKEWRCKQEKSSIVDEQDQEEESSVIGKKEESPVSAGERAFLASMGMMCPAAPPHPVKPSPVDDDDPSLNRVVAVESSDSRAENRQEMHAPFAPSAGEQAFIDAMASPTEQKGKLDARGLSLHNTDRKTTKRTRKNNKRKKSQAANQNDPRAKKSKKSKGGAEEVKPTGNAESEAEEKATHAKDVGLLLEEKQCLERELARMREEVRQISGALFATEGSQLTSNSGGIESFVARQICPRTEKGACGDDPFSPSRIPDDRAPEETKATHKSLDPPVFDGIEPVADCGETNAEPTASGTHHAKDIQVQHETKVGNPLLPDQKSPATGKELKTPPDTKNGNMGEKVAETLPTRSEGTTGDSRQLLSCSLQSRFYRSWQLRLDIERSKHKLFFIKVPLPSNVAGGFTWRLVQVPAGEGDSFEAMIGIYRVREYRPHCLDKKKHILRECRFWPQTHCTMPDGSLSPPLLMNPKKVLSGKMTKSRFASMLTTNLLETAIVGPFDFEISSIVHTDRWTELERSAARLGIATSDINKIIGQQQKTSQIRCNTPATVDPTPSPIPHGAQPKGDGAKHSDEDDSEKPQTLPVDSERASRQFREALEKSSDKLFFVKRGHSPGQFAWSLVKVVGDEAGGPGNYRVLEYASHIQDRKEKAQRHCRFWPRRLDRCRSKADTFTILTLNPRKKPDEIAAQSFTANLLDDWIVGPFDFIPKTDFIGQRPWDCLKRTAAGMGIATDEIDQVIASDQCKVGTGVDGIETTGADGIQETGVDGIQATGVDRIQATAETSRVEMAIDVDESADSGSASLVRSIDCRNNNM